MRQLILFPLMVVLAVTSSMAQIGRFGRSAVQAPRQASAAGERMMRQFQQQSQRAEQAARKAASVSRFKVKPSGIRVVPVPNLDNDDQKRDQKRKIIDNKKRPRPVTSNLLSFKPLPKIKTFREMEDERIAAKYDTIKMLVSRGAYLEWPFNLFQLADYAKRHNNEQFVIACLERVKTDRLTPKYLDLVARRYPALDQYMPEISRAVVISAYSKMADAKLQGIDCDSARMQQGDTLLMVTDQYNPNLNPLVILSCFYHPSMEVERYKEAADSIAATYDQWPDEFKDTFARDFLLTLIENKEHATALDYFGREPLKQYPDSLADFALDMTTCAIVTQNGPLASSYLEHALALDSVAANDYWAELYDVYWYTFIVDPSQTELADWLIEYSQMPADNAINLSTELINRYWPKTDFSWVWETLSDYTPEREAARLAILHILDKGTEIDEGRSEANTAPFISYLKAEMLMADPAMTADAKSLLDNLTTTDQPDLRCRAIIGQAYIAAHGLDKPKEAMKILKKAIKQLDDPSVTNYVRGFWYDYMAALATRLGKAKDAEKYRRLKSEMS